MSPQFFFINRVQSRVTTTFETALVFSMLAIWFSQSQYLIILREIKIDLHCSFRGKTAVEFLEWLTPSSLSSLRPYGSTLSVLLNEKGGIIDDTIVTKHASDAFYVVTNAGRRDRDLAWFKEKVEAWNASEKGKDGPVEHEVLENWGLLAIQGMLRDRLYQYSLTSRISFRTRSRFLFTGPDFVRPLTIDVWEFRFRPN